jgi:hypothetical protein
LDVAAALAEFGHERGPRRHTGSKTVGKASVRCDDGVLMPAIDFLIGGVATAALVAYDVQSSNNGASGVNKVAYVPNTLFVGSGLLGVWHKHACSKWRREAPPEEYARIEALERARAEAAAAQARANENAAAADPAGAEADPARTDVDAATTEPDTSVAEQQPEQPVAAPAQEPQLSGPTVRPEERTTTTRTTTTRRSKNAVSGVIMVGAKLTCTPFDNMPACQTWCGQHAAQKCSCVSGSC